MGGAAPKAWPLIGHWRPWWRDWPLEMLALHREQGDVVPLKLGPKRAYLVADPDLIQKILGSSEGLIKEHGLQVTRKLFLGDGLVTSEGETHKKGRQVARPAMDPSHFPGYAAKVLACLERTQGEWIPGQGLDIHRQAFRLAMRIVAESLLGLDLDAGLDALKADIEEVSAFSAQAVANPLYLLYRHLPLPRARRFRAARDRFNQMLEKALADAKGGQGWLAHLGGRGPEMGMQAAQIRDIAKSLLLAGQETSANALAWTLYLLSRHPEAERRLLEEFAANPLPADPGAPKPLPYARAVLRESMRLYPPVWTLGREALKDMELGSLRLKKGDTVYMSQYVVQRDPRWFPEPERFDPGRFEEGAPERPAFAYFPFGAGTRACIGENFAMLELGLALRAWLPKWRFVLDEPGPIGLDAFISLKPKGGLRMRVELR